MTSIRESLERASLPLVERLSRLPRAFPFLIVLALLVGGILIPGSISVVQQLLAAGLVDELRLLVHPVAARKGRRLFDEGDVPYHLTVTATEAFPTGVVRVIYAPGQAPGKVGYDDVKDQVPDRG